MQTRRTFALRLSKDQLILTIQNAGNVYIHTPRVHIICICVHVFFNSIAKFRSTLYHKMFLSYILLYIFHFAFISPFARCKHIYIMLFFDSMSYIYTMKRIYKMFSLKSLHISFTDVLVLQDFKENLSLNLTEFQDIDFFSTKDEDQLSWFALNSSSILLFQLIVRNNNYVPVFHI